MGLLPDPLWTANGWFPLTDTEAWFDDLLAADLGGGGGYATITYEGISAVAENAAGATTLAITWPTVAAGDVAVLFVGVSSSTLPTNPGTFTSQVTSTSGGSSPSFRVSTRVCDGSETGTLNVTTPNVVSRGYIVVFRNVDNATPLEAVGTPFASSTSTTAYDLPSVTTGMAGCALLDMVIGNASTGSFTPATVPASFTEITDDNTPLPHGEAAYHIWSGLGATGIGDVVRSAGTRGCGVRIALRPASSGGTSHAISATGTGNSDGAANVTATYVGTATGSGTSAGAANATITTTASANGSGTSDGAAAAGLRTPVTATGSGVSDGAGNITVTWRVTGSGSGQSDGACAASISGGSAVSASGSGQSDGAANVTARYALTATGTGTSSGAAAAGSTITVTAAGTGASAGAANVVLRHVVTAAGSGQSSGAGNIVATYRITAAGTGTSDGAAAVTLVPSGGPLNPAPADRTLTLAPESRILALTVEAPRVVALSPESRVYQLAVDPSRVTALPPESRLHALETP